MNASDHRRRFVGEGWDNLDTYECLTIWKEGGGAIKTVNMWQVAQDSSVNDCVLIMSSWQSTSEQVHRLRVCIVQCAALVYWMSMQTREGGGPQYRAVPGCYTPGIWFPIRRAFMVSAAPAVGLPAQRSGLVRGPPLQGDNSARQERRTDTNAFLHLTWTLAVFLMSDERWDGWWSNHPKVMRGN